MKRLLSIKQTEKVPFLLTLRDEAGEESLYRLTKSEYEAVGAPTVGSLIDEEVEERIAALNEAHAATAAALRILSFGDNNQAALTQKLRRRGFSAAAAEKAVEAMQRRGYINEEEQVYRLAVAYANRKLWGPRKILPALLAKGYAQADIKKALCRATESGEIDFEALRQVLLEKKLTEKDPQTARALLYRNGF